VNKKPNRDEWKMPIYCGSGPCFFTLIDYMLYLSHAPVLDLAPTLPDGDRLNRAPLGAGFSKAS